MFTNLKWNFFFIEKKLNKTTDAVVDAVNISH